MRRQCMRLLTGILAAAFLSACGGGGGGGGTTPPTVAKSTATVSGVAMISLSALVSKSAAKLDGVAIEVVSYDKNDQEIGRAPATTDANGGFAAQVSLLDAGGYVIVKASKDGYSQFQKRVDYTTPGNIELKAVLQGLNVAFANMSGVTSNAITAGVGKSSEPSFSFAVVKYPNGVKKALAGNAIRAAKAAGGTSELEINIPAATLPGVKKLKGELNTYDPAKDSESFPGSYTGVVGGKEGKMVSLAFDFMKITNADTGENVGSVAKKLAKSGVTKAAASATTVTRSIYSSSCDNLFIEDYNLTAAGWQVPVWSLNPSTGKWLFIGEGTIVDNAGNIISSPTKLLCTGGTYYLKILVANAEFEKNWWNLDHIVFDTPKEVCLTGKFTYDNGDAIKDMYLSLSGSNIDYKSGKTGADGSYTITTVLLNKNSTDKKASLGYYDLNGNYSMIGSFYDATNNPLLTLGDSPSCTSKDVQLPKPCEVSGKLTGDNVANRWLSMQGTNFYRGVNTDSTGAFSSQVACNTDINMYIGGSSSLASFNVNNAVVAPETTDASGKVTLSSLTVPNIPPSGYVYLSQRSIKNTGTVTAEISAYDEDGNYPVSYTLKDNNGTTLASGTIDGTTTYAATKSITGLAVGEYVLELVLKDSKNGERTIPAGNLSVSDGSRPPVVNAYASRLYVNSCGSNNTVNLSGSAYSPEGNAITGAWTGVSGCVDSSTGIGSLTSTCKDVPVTTNPAKFTYTVTDSVNSKSAFRDILISTYSSAPWVSNLVASPAQIIEGATGAARNVTLTAAANHSDGITLNGSWTLDGAPLTECPDVVGLASGAQTTCTYSIPSTATVGQQFKFRFTATGCSQSAYREATVTYRALQVPPEITSIIVPSAVGLNSASTTLSAVASDANGDNITWSWSVVSGGGTLGTGCSGSGASPVSSACTYTPPAAAATVVLRFSASDGTSTTTKDKTLSVVDGTSVVIQ